MVSIALTPGCPAGIGPELFPKALYLAKLSPGVNILWCASPALFLKHAQKNSLTCSRNGLQVVMETQDGQLNIDCLMTDDEDISTSVTSGIADANTLIIQKEWLDRAIALAQQKKVQAIVTGPIRKTALSSKGKAFGQTEYLHQSLAADQRPPLMCFAGGDFVLGLATVHVPLSQVSQSLNKEMLIEKLTRLNEACEHYFSISQKDVRLLCLGLNPHAGEGGMLGKEEIVTIAPALKEFNERGYSTKGPVAADGFFGHLPFVKEGALPHGVLAMYHDQGLAGYKLHSKGNAVNFTVGLSVVRTSPAHGTADDIAGQYVADPTSLIKAIEAAQKMAINAHPPLYR